MPEWLKPEFVWFVIGLVLLIAELGIPGVLVLFFGLGAWLVAAVCFIWDIGTHTQIILFLVSSIIMLVLFRKKLKSLFFTDLAKYENLTDTIDDYKGQHVFVVREITPLIKGKVEYHGTVWDASSEVDIPKGTVAEIIAKENITLIVKPVE